MSHRSICAEDSDVIQCLLRRRCLSLSLSESDNTYPHGIYSASGIGIREHPALGCLGLCDGGSTRRWYSDSTLGLAADTNRNYKLAIDSNRWRAQELEAFTRLLLEKEVVERPELQRVVQETADTKKGEVKDCRSQARRNRFRGNKKATIYANPRSVARGLT